MEGLKGEFGGCIFIELDQTTREQTTIYNQDYYKFEDINLDSCLSWVDGGAIYIKNVYKMKIFGDSALTNSYAFGSGGGINFICDVLDTGSCELVM